MILLLLLLLLLLLFVFIFYDWCKKVYYFFMNESK